MAEPIVLRAGDHRRMPWRNGGGVTREIARAPQGPDDGEFDWRISIAEVAAGGPFSAFPGIDRVLIRIGAAPMTLAIDGVEHELPAFVPCAFAGEAATSATLPGGPTSDLNVMTRRGRVTARVAVRSVPASERIAGRDGAHLVLVGLAGTPVAHRDGRAFELALHDALVCDGGADVVMHGEAATVAVVELDEVSN